MQKYMIILVSDFLVITFMFIPGYYILSTKRNAIFYLQFLGLKIIDIKNCFNSVVLPSNKDLDCIVSS